MEDSSTVFKVLMFLTFSLPLSSSDTHTLLYFYTVGTPVINVPEFTAVGVMNEEQCVYYDSTIRKMIPKTGWMQKISTDDSLYWNKETERVEDRQDIMTTIMKTLNKDEGNHTLLWMLGCALDNSIIRGYSQYLYDGEDFISLDLNWNLEHGQGTWTAANDEAKNFLKEWDPKGEKVKKQKEYLNGCTNQIKKFVPYSNKALERKDPPTASVFQKHSPSPEVVCHATAFFPEVVKISWRKDGENVTKNVELGVTFSKQDGSFQKRIILKVPAEDLQKHKYTCVIQHSSLKEEMVLEVPKDGGSGGRSGGGLMIIIIGVVALTVIVVVVAGVIVCRKKNMQHAERPHEV